MKKGKEWMVNEQCFRDGHLKFVGKTQISTFRCIEPDAFDHLMKPPGDKKWWFKVSSGKDAGNPDNWETHEAVKTNVGTNPEGSEWMMVTLDERVGSVEWAIKDLVKES